jgi:4'-phosphopantetheinyl transferase
MIKIYFSFLDRKLDERKWSHLLHQVPLTFAEKINRFKRWEDRQNSLMGKILLLEGLREFNLKVGLEDIRYSAEGKPYFNDSVSFNISHSGPWVVCVLTDCGRVGIDIEEIESIALTDFTDQFSDVEWKEINTSTNQYETFYKLWTIKEAVIKADGRGLSIPMKDIQMHGDRALLNGGEWYLKKIEIAEKIMLYMAADFNFSENVLCSEFTIH